MGELNMEEMSLPALFEQARQIHLSASESGIDQETLRKGCEALQQCEEMIGKLGLFSSNETKDDIGTTNLKYLLVPCYLAELTEKIAQDDRIQIIKASMAKLKEFMSFCEVMELVPEEELESSAQGGSNSFADRRAKKIARFKRQRAAESKLLEIKERKERRGRSTKASALSTPVEAAEEDLLDDDVEEEREAWLTSISLAICKAFDLLEMLKKEEEMLSAMKERQLQEGDKDISQVLDKRTKRAEAWHRDAADRAHYTRPAQPITCATFAQDVIEGRAKVSQAHEHKHQPMIFGPASLVGGNPTSERERMAVQVFQPSYRLPTMSIEEAGLNEMEIMNKFQERNAKLMEEANSSWYKDNRKLRPGEEEDEDDDAAQDKARAFNVSPLKVVDGFVGAIGNTPLIRLKKLSEETGSEILGKAEFMNPGGSVKDRAALYVVKDAEERGELRPGGTVVEGTAGNTGIGLAHVCRSRGYKCVIYMPDTQSQEKIDLLRMLGAEVYPVPAVAFENPENYNHQARRHAEKIPNAVWTNQFDNIANRRAHLETTGPEIWEQTHGLIDGFTCATGTGGTFAGVTRFLKGKNPKVKSFIADPPGSVLHTYFKSSGKLIERSGSSITEGIGQGRVTTNLQQDVDLIDDALHISDEKTIEMVYRLLDEEGIYVGASTALNVVAAVDMAKILGPGKKIVTILNDGAYRYQSRLFSRKWLESKKLLHAIPEHLQKYIVLP